MFSSYLCIDYVNVCVVEFYLYFVITNLFCLLNLQKISKRESSLQVRFIISLFHFVFWYELVNFRNRVLIFMFRFKLFTL